MAKLAYLFLFISLSHACDAYKILVVFTAASPSHNILGQGYVRHLLEAGHEVTYVTYYPTNKTTSKYHEVDISAQRNFFRGNIPTLKQIMDKESPTNMVTMLPKLVQSLKLPLQNENFNKFINDPAQNFDLVIVEWFFSEVFSAMATVFNCPLIWSSSVEPHWMVLQLMHEASNPAFNSDALSSTIPPFSFVERVQSLFTQVLVKAVKYFYLENFEREIYNDYFGPLVAKRGRTLPPFEQVIYNASFMLTNSHSSLGQPISVPPNSKEIGGYHIDSKVKPLPEDLRKLMDESKHGVIYFSMGSNAKSRDFPDDLKQDFLRVLGDVKQTVIWKFEEDLPNRPPNVHIVQWAPQQSILAHPNLRIFITHGGLLSTTETIFFGVPTIVMPYGADQHLNAVRAVKKGYALKVDLSYTMAADLKLAMNEMLSNSKYTERAKELSKLFHDRMVPPGKELVHWVEHVVRTGGAPHLRSPALMLPWYQKMYLDLAAVVLVVMYAFKLILMKLFSLVKSIFKKNVTVNKKKKN